MLHLPYFVGYESYSYREEFAVFGAEKGFPLARLVMDYYENRRFVSEAGEYGTNVLPDIVNSIISKHYQIYPITTMQQFTFDANVINVFPREWFCANIHLRPQNADDITLMVTDDTYCIHWFANSWISRFASSKRLFRKYLMPLGVYKMLYHFKQYWNKICQKFFS